jgi:hypothetical protein
VSIRQKPDRTVIDGNLRAEVLRQDRGIWYTFAAYQAGELILLGHELRALARLSARLADEYDAVRLAELESMKRPATKPLVFGRRKVGR